MEFKAENSKQLLAQFEFPKLFIEELGWDRHSADLPVVISGTTFALNAVAEKRGMVAWVCLAPTGQQIPDRATRKKIEIQVAKTNWFPAWRDIPKTTDMDGKPSLPARTAGYRFRTADEADIVFALLCSSLGFGGGQSHLMASI
jgi:hypothetical protein